MDVIVTHQISIESHKTHPNIVILYENPPVTVLLNKLPSLPLFKNRHETFFVE